MNKELTTDSKTGPFAFKRAFFILSLTDYYIENQPHL